MLFSQYLHITACIAHDGSTLVDDYSKIHWEPPRCQRESQTYLKKVLYCCYNVHYSIVHCCIVHCCIVHFCIVHCCIVYCCIVHCCIVHVCIVHWIVYAAILCTAVLHTVELDTNILCTAELYTDVLYIGVLYTVVMYTTVMYTAVLYIKTKYKKNKYSSNSSGHITNLSQNMYFLLEKKIYSKRGGHWMCWQNWCGTGRGGLANADIAEIRGRGVGEVLTLADKGEGQVREMLTLADYHIFLYYFVLLEILP